MLLAIGAAALIFFTRTAEYGTIYPLFLLGTEHTYGVIGLSTAALVVAMVGAGWYRTGAFLLGVAPCIHPALGSWAGLAVGLAVLSDFRNLRVELRPAFPWFVSGCGITLVSLLIQFGFAPAMPVTMTRLETDDLSTFIRLWDGHRAAVSLRSTGVQLNAAAAIIASTWLTFSSAELPSSSRLLLRITAAGSLLAIAMVPLSWIPPDELPSALLVLMPGRYLNFGALVFVALLIGLLGSCRAVWSRLVLLFLSCGLLVTNRSMLWEFLAHHHNVRFQIDVAPLRIVWLSAAAVLAGAIWERSRNRRPQRTRRPKRTHRT